ncbi:MAG: hypothetical protein K2Q34_05000 [Alphaproteobacteria bacterium]|nr:hypothetical protein [Alphaproteobacteria bacterium]
MLKIFKFKKSYFIRGFFSWILFTTHVLGIEHRSIPHMDAADKKVEYYIHKPDQSPSKGIILFIHSHQLEERIGARILIDRGFCKLM